MTRVPTAFGLAAAAVALSVVSPAPAGSPAQKVTPVEANRITPVAPVTTPSTGGDFGITALNTDASCAVRVTIVNQGGALPSNHENIKYSVRTPGDAGDYPASIPAAQLREPGSKVTVSYPLLSAGADTTTYTASVVSSVRDHRTGAAPTTLTESFFCQAARPNLSLSVAVNPDCSKTITVKSTGAKIDRDTFWTPGFASISRSNDSWAYQKLGFSELDPSKLLMASGGSITFHEGPDYRAYERYDYEIAGFGVDGNKNDDKAGGTVPASCKGSRPPSDVDVTGLSLDANCNAMAQFSNRGPNKASGMQVSVNFFKANAVVSGQQTSLGALGATNVVSSSLKIGTTPTAVRVDVTTPNITRTRTATLQCPK